MITPDMINGTFELLGSVAISFSIWRMHKDKLVRGVSWKHFAFFTAWGWWNIYYYPAIDQWWSFYGGVALVLTNSWLFGAMIYYLWRERNDWIWVPEGEYSPAAAHWAKLEDKY